MFLILQVWIHILTFVGGISIEVGYSPFQIVMKGDTIMEIVKNITFELVHCARGVNGQL